MSKLVRVDDLFKDGTTFYKTLKKGEGSASPYKDCHICCKYLIIIINLNSEGENRGRWNS